jgi:hypothetical protein
MQGLGDRFQREKLAICAEFNYPHFHSFSCSLWKKNRPTLLSRFGVAVSSALRSLSASLQLGVERGGESMGKSEAERHAMTDFG